MENIERIENDGKLLAIIVRKGFKKEGLTFVTGPEYGLQVGVHIQKKGFKVRPHMHLPFKELKGLEIQEMFYVKKGKIKVSLHDKKGHNLADIKGCAGDVLILISGHSLLCLEDSQLIEVKQGPYRGQAEKRYFEE